MAVLRRLREWSKVPVIVLSVRDRDSDKVPALDSGANDYLSKPFSTNELLARLRVVQRYHQPAAKASVFTSGHLQVDLAARTVKVRGQPVKLARTEYALLRYFVQHAGRVLTHSQLIARNLGFGRRRKNGAPARLCHLSARETGNQSGQTRIARHRAGRRLPPQRPGINRPICLILPVDIPGQTGLKWES